MTSADTSDRHRLDKWLWHVRLFKTRSMAADAVSGGKVKLDGERVKPSRSLRIGQMVHIASPDRIIEVQVLSLPDRRGPAAAARACYAETAASIERGAQRREQHRLASLARTWPDHRPDKRERRQLEQLRRRQG